jgi:Spy/CpxP family protein refolding chaperone
MKAELTMAEGFALTMDDGGFQTMVNAPQEPQPRSATVNAAKTPAVRRVMTADEAVAVKCIRAQVTFSVGHWDKKFMRGLPDEITEKQAAQVWRIFKTYRRQIQHERKAELLAMAERLSAPDLRKERREAAQVAQEKARCRMGVAA